MRTFFELLAGVIGFLIMYSFFYLLLSF